MTVKIDPRALADLMRSQQGPVVRELAETAQAVKAEARRRVGKDTRALHDRILTRFVSARSGVAIDVIAERPYARHHHEGTRPHVIAARRAKVLAFRWPRRGPGTFFFPRVNHPGTKPNRFLVEAAEAVFARKRR